MSELEPARVTGRGDLPKPWSTFADCKFCKLTLRNLHERGFSQPTPIQALCWPIAAAGRNIIGVAQTGSGKTLAFLVPAYDSLHLQNVHPRACRKGPLMLVLAPTRELALQIQSEAAHFGQQMGINSAAVYGGAPWKEQLTAIKRGPHVVVGTPGRLQDFLNKNILSLSQVRWLAIDEADQMLDIGFEPQLRSIVEHVPHKRQTCMYTATWPKAVQQLASDFLVDPIRVQLASGERTCNQDVLQEVQICANAQAKMEALLEILRCKSCQSDKILVFVNTKVMCSLLEEDLSRMNVAVAVIHGDLTQEQREGALKAFTTCKLPVLLATDVAARGLDIKDVTTVINYDVAQSAEAHVHRIGRTGRAGSTGKAVTFIQPSVKQDCRMACAVADSILLAGQSVPAAMQRLLDSSASENPQSKPAIEFRNQGQATSTVNTSLTNPVLSLFGHAKARAIASDARLVERTNNEGKRMLTQQSRETKRHARGRRGELQLGWVKYRHIEIEELEPVLLRSRLNAASIGEVAKLMDSTNLVHTVITNVFDESFIVTNYFGSQDIMDYKELVRSTIFDFLDHDDPSVITEAMESPIFVEGLRSEFMSGDTGDPRLWKTLSKLKAPLNLLHKCCEKDFPACVELLLSQYAMQTAQEPHHTLVEPDIWVDKWRNTAFHSAAYRGNARCLSHLIYFAKQHAVDVTGLKDKDGKTPLDISRDRGHIGCYNMLAPLFGVAAMHDGLADQELAIDAAQMFVDFASPDTLGGEIRTDPFEISVSQLRAWTTVEHRDVKFAEEHPVCSGGVQLLIPEGAMLVRVETLDGASLWDASNSAQILTRRLDSYSAQTVRVTAAQRRRCELPQQGTPAELRRILQSLVAKTPKGSAPYSLTVLGFQFLQSEDEAQQMREWFQALLEFHTISFRKCSCETTTTLHICQALCHGLESGLSHWRQLYVFPSTGMAGEKLPEFEHALPKLVEALRRSSVLHISRSGCKSCGIPGGGIPQIHKSWLGILRHCLDGSRAINMIKHRRDMDPSELLERQPDMNNFFIQGIVDIWRHELDYTQLFDSSVKSLEEALRPGIEDYVREWLRSMSVPFHDRGRQISLEECSRLHDLRPEELEELLQHLDLAVWALLRMHRLLPFAPALVSQELPAVVREHLPRTLEYASKDSGFGVFEKTSRASRDDTEGRGQAPRAMTIGLH